MERTNFTAQWLVLSVFLFLCSYGSCAYVNRVAESRAAQYPSNVLEEEVRGDTLQSENNLGR